MSVPQEVPRDWIHLETPRLREAFKGDIGGEAGCRRAIASDKTTAQQLHKLLGERGYSLSLHGYSTSLSLSAPS